MYIMTSSSPPWITHCSTYEVDSELVVRVLYVLPTINTVLLTARNINIAGKATDQRCYSSVSLQCLCHSSAKQRCSWLRDI